MVVPIARPRLEGNIAVGEDRRIGFAEFGAPRGKAIFWLHGTPGARRQIPVEARICAERENIRLIGVDRPGIGSSTPFQYENVLGFSRDMETIADTLGVDEMAVVGLSGGGPYTLACAAGMPDRVVAAGVLGGVAPTSGPDAIGGGLMALGSAVAPFLQVAGGPIRLTASTLIRVVRPIASPALDIYALMSPEGDRRLLLRPEFKAMFSTICLTAAVSNWRLRSPMSLFSPGIGDSGSTRSRSRFVGGTATATTSSRSRTVSMSWICCRTPSFSAYLVRVIWSDWGSARTSCTR